MLHSDGWIIRRRPGSNVLCAKNNDESYRKGKSYEISAVLEPACHSTEPGSYGQDPVELRWKRSALWRPEPLPGDGHELDARLTTLHPGSRL